MTKLRFSAESFKLLGELELNNRKEWFDAHRDDIRTHLQEPFVELLETATAKMKKHFFSLSGGKQTVFRLHRDVRFSKDKNPYKTHIGGLLTETGTKDVDGALVYVHLAKDGGFIASGFYQLGTKEVNKMRDRMLEDPAGFTKIVKKLQKSGYDISADDKLKTMPLGYSEHRNHALVEYLRLKSLIIQQPQTKQAWVNGSIVDEITKLAKAATDLIVFGTTAIASGAKSSVKKGV